MSRVDVPFDAATVASSRRWSAWTTAVSVAVAAAAFTVVIVYFAQGTIFITIATGVILALLLLVGVAPMTVGIRNEITRLTGGSPGLALGVSAEGVHSDVIPTLAWSEITAVLIVDLDEATREKAKRRLASWGPAGWGARLMRRCGMSFQRVLILMPEGKARRLTIADPKRRRAIGLWSAAFDPDVGELAIPTDPFVAEADRERLLEALWRFARAAGVDIRHHTSTSEMMDHIHEYTRKSVLQ